MADGSGARTLGVVGTMVWDTIIPADAGEPTHEWGGIAYSLAAFDASLGRGWKALPLVQVGSDLEPSARTHLGALSRVRTDALRSVPEPNNRVELRYHDAHERIETLSGGVPAWSPSELIPRALECDALYVNFVSGFEMSLETARQLRQAFAGPIYADLHSLFLGIDNAGERFPQCPVEALEWFRLFDFVQMNQAEAALLRAGGVGSTEPGPAALVVTDGPNGVRYEAVPSLLRSPPEWPVAGENVERTARGKVSSDPRARIVDPTGCGDVWGATCFAEVMGGTGLRQAAERASRTAEKALGIRGTSGLHAALGSGALERGTLASIDRKGEAAS